MARCRHGRSAFRGNINDAYPQQQLHDPNPRALTFRHEHPSSARGAARQAQLTRLRCSSDLGLCLLALRTGKRHSFGLAILSIPGPGSMLMSAARPMPGCRKKRAGRGLVCFDPTGIIAQPRSRFLAGGREKRQASRRRERGPAEVFKWNECESMVRGARPMIFRAGEL